MRECFTYGSVRGAAGNGGPYRDPRLSPDATGVDDPNILEALLDGGRGYDSARITGNVRAQLRNVET